MTLTGNTPRLPIDSIMKIHSQSSSRRRRGGFSLAELMVVIVIIGLLATLVVPQVIKRLFTANDVIARASITVISNAVTEYQIQNNGVAPDSLDALVEKDENGFSFLDRDTLPTDPWGNEFRYEPPQGSIPYRVYTYGADGEPGGEGQDSDISNIDIKNS
jgi:general secretion pathway protein G